MNEAIISQFTRLTRIAMVCAFGVMGIPLYAAPTIGTTAVTPISIPVGVAAQITVTSVITDPSVIAGGVNLQRLDSSGRVTAILGILHDDGQNGDAAAGDGIYTLQVTLTESTVGPVMLRVSAAFKGLLTRVFSGVMTVNVIGTSAPQVIITSPANLSFMNISPTTVTGTVSDPKATVAVNGLPAPVGNGAFSVSVPLAEGPNIITATATGSAGVSTASITVTLDTTPPHVTITSPPDQFVTTDAAISVAGNVNDIVVGTVNDQQAQVTVNGIAAQVANRTFLATNVPLNLGANVIRAVARDRSGNPATTQITVTRQAPSPGQIRLISGNNQTAMIGAVLPAPLVVALTDPNGNPAANQAVLFKVTQNNGMVISGTSPAAATAMVSTNAQGQAQVQWTLGMRAGAGGNTVEAYAVGYGGTAIFTATGTQGTPGKIVIDTGNNQIGPVNQPLARPLIAVVIDAGNNRLANVPVTFTVKQGGGSFGGQQSLTVNTDPDGRAAATLTLGFQEGNSNNLVEANFPLNQGFPVSFTASGRAPGDAASTSISGVVLDNSNQPIPNVTIRAVSTNAITANKAAVNAAPSVQTDAQGQFSITGAPVGLVKLMVDGSTTTRPGAYPSLEYDLVTVSGQNNTVGQPIYLLPLNPANQLCVTATTGGGTLTIPEAPGFSLTFGPGQVTFPGGSQTGCVSVTVVHPDKVPMPPGFGQQPRFIVTIQPTGALFNPPAAITLPNVDGLAPRQVTEMYSYDHDISSFVAIGTGTVSDDGMVIRSSPGVGVLKAGWHCGGNPNANGTVADCAPCNICENDHCVPDPLQTTCTSACIVGGVGLCQNGTCTGGTYVNCSSGNPCIDDGCNWITGCTHTVNQKCQNICTGHSVGSSCQVNGVNGTCVADANANLQCQLCQSLGAGAACNSGGSALGVCTADPNTGILQCGGHGNQCPGGCPACVNGKCCSAGNCNTCNLTAVTAAANGQNPAMVPVGAAISFSALTQQQNCSAITYSWNFGDGVGSSGLQSPSYQYAAAGSYTATVTATCPTCGTLTASVTVTVVSITGTINPDPADVFPGRSYQRFGVGEPIQLSFTSTPALTAAQLGGLQWTVAPAFATNLNAPSPDGTGTFTGPFPGLTAASINVTLQLIYASGPNQGQIAETKTITIVEPSTASYEIPDPGFGIAHQQFTGYVQVIGEWHLLPSDVSFRHITFQEGITFATATGYYATPNTGHDDNGEKHVPGPAAIPLLPTDATSGSIVPGDMVHTSVLDIDPFTNGVFTWNIPWTYTFGSNPGKTFMTVPHVATMTANQDGTGTICISKSQIAVCRNTSDATSTN